MDVRKKVGLLVAKHTGKVHADEDDQHSVASRSHASSQQQASTSRPQSARTCTTVAHAADSHPPGAASRRDQQQQSALKLWRQWADEALGPLSSEPTTADLSAQSKRSKQLERKCAELAAMAQRRLALSASLRDGGELVAGARSAMRHSGAGQKVHSELVFSAKEQRRNRTYEAVKDIGKAERFMHNSSGSTATSATAGAAWCSPPQPKSRALLDAMIANGGMISPSEGNQQQRNAYRSSSSGNGGAKAWANSTRPPRSTSSNNTPQAAAGHRQLPHTTPTQQAPGLMSTLPPGSAAHAMLPNHTIRDLRSSSSVRPHSASAVPYSSSGWTHTSSTAGTGAAGTTRGTAAAPLAQLQQEAESLRVQLDEAHAAVESQTETESQLRDTIDLLRARLHGQTQREVENQRRLQQHTRLEPLFDRLAECFTFQTPEEVIDRLELLEDDKLGTFDQLLQTQEEVARLQGQVEEANRKVDAVRTQMSTDAISSSARLQQQNEELRAELESTEYLNRKLTERQGQLVLLQSAVIDLWGRCQDDPAFAAANRDTGSRRQRGAAGTRSEVTAADDGVQQSAVLDDPLSVLSLVKEYVISRSPNLSARHYLDAQQVANRVWSHHFRHKTEIRGKVIETFEQLSTLADIMASKIKMVSQQLERSKENERFLAASLARVDRQRKGLEVELEHRNQLVRDMSGVPRKLRPQSAVSRTMEVVGPAAMLSGASPGSRPPRPQSATAGSPGSQNPRMYTTYGSGTGSSAVGRQASGHAAVRPQSAPSRRPQSAARPAATASYRHLDSGGSSGNSAGRRAPEGQAGATPRRPRPSSARAGDTRGSQAVHISQAPEGEHWSMYSPPAPLPGPAVSGALFHAAATAAAAAPAAGAAAGDDTTAGSSQALRWVAPDKANIEASFLCRLERAASARG